MNLYKRHQTIAKIAFSPQEQSLTSLSTLFAYHKYYKRPAQIRKGRHVEECQFTNLCDLAEESGFTLEKYSLDSIKSWEMIESVSIVHLKQGGTAILEKNKANEYIINHATYGWRKLGKDPKAILDQLSVPFALVVRKSPTSKTGRYKKPQSALFTTLIAEVDFRKTAIVIIILSLLRALTKLIDPIVKNLFMTLVVQLDDINWARPLAWLYFLIAVSGAALVLLSGYLTILLSTRLALRWSYSTMINLLRVPKTYLNLRGNGDLLNRIRSSESVANFIGSTEIALVGSLINVVIMIAFLATTSLVLSALLCIFQMLGFTISILTATAKKERTDQHTQRVATETSSLVATLNSITNITRQTKTRDAFRSHQLKIISRLHSQQRLSVFVLIVNFATRSLDTLQSISLLTIAALLIMNGDITLGQYVAFSAIMSNVIAPFKSLSSFVTKLQNIKTIEERIQDITDEAELVATSEQVLPSSEFIKIEYNDPIRQNAQSTSLTLSQSDLPLILKVDTPESVLVLETLFARDGQLGSNFRLHVPGEDGKGQLLTVRSKPYLYKQSIINNIVLWKKPGSSVESQNLTRMINKLGLAQQINIDSQDSLLGETLTNDQILMISAARSLWRKPETLVVPLCEVQDNQSASNLANNLLEYCAESGIKPLFISSQNLDLKIPIIEIPVELRTALQSSVGALT